MGAFTSKSTTYVRKPDDAELLERQFRIFAGHGCHLLMLQPGVPPRLADVGKALSFPKTALPCYSFPNMNLKSKEAKKNQEPTIDEMKIIPNDRDDFFEQGTLTRQ